MKKKFIALTAVFIFTYLFVFSGCTGNSAQGTANFNTKKEITVISREDGSGTRGAFIELFGIEVKEDGVKKDMTTKEAVIAGKTDVMLTNIANDPYSIGYVSIGSLNNNVKALSVDSVTASSENVKNGTYKISRPFNIATKADISETAQDFISFILSSEGQQVVSKDYVSVIDNAAPYSGSKPNGKVTVAGSSSVTPVMEKLKEAYAAINPNATIEIQMSDSSAGMNGAIEGTCDIGMASRELSDKEKAELTPYAIALDGIAVIVNNQNSLSDITKDQVKSIYTGESTIWNQIIN